VFSWQEKWILQYSKSPESSISLQHWYEQEHHERNSHITDELPMMNLQKTNQIPEGEHQNTRLVGERFCFAVQIAKRQPSLRMVIFTEFQESLMKSRQICLLILEGIIPHWHQRWCHKEHMLLKQGNIACHLIKGMYAPKNIFHYAPRSAPSSGTLIRVCSSAHKVTLPPLSFVHDLCDWLPWCGSNIVFWIKL
jgi:hypothetical protein